MRAGRTLSGVVSAGFGCFWADLPLTPVFLMRRGPLACSLTRVCEYGCFQRSDMGEALRQMQPYAGLADLYPGADFEQLEANGFEFGATEFGPLESHAPKMMHNHIGGGV